MIGWYKLKSTKERMRRMLEWSTHSMRRYRWICWCSSMPSGVLNYMRVPSNWSIAFLPSEFSLAVQILLLALLYFNNGGNVTIGTLYFNHAWNITVAIRNFTLTVRDLELWMPIWNNTLSKKDCNWKRNLEIHGIILDKDGIQL